jgi:hypothetical protein
MDMRTVLTDAAAREGLLARCGLGGRDIDVVISNPPYVPMSGDLAWQRCDVEAIRALPVRDLGMLGQSDALLDRVERLRTALIAAENGGPDGLRFVREIVAHVPTFAARVAWLQASYTSPMTVLELLERSGLHIETLVAYATPFGGSATYPRSAQHAYLSEMREQGDAYFWSAPDGTRWILLLGFSVRRGARPANYDGDAVRASLCRFLTLFGERGPDVVSRWHEDVPFAMEVGRYDA